MITDSKLLTPHQIVRVELPSAGCEMSRRSYMGELISHPIPVSVSDARPRTTTHGHVQAVEFPSGAPEQTIMIRRAPGHPGTMDELPISMLWWLPKGDRPKFVHYATVEGKLAFPEDMLRYEQAVPVNFKVLAERPYFERCDPTDNRLIIATADRNRIAAWSPRWASFGWRVLKLKTEPI